jgi:cytochrome c peroxidase
MNKNRKKIVLVFFTASCAFFLSSFIILGDKLNEILELTIPANWPNPVYDFKNNPVSKANFELGRELFYDPILSADSTISCASCHLQQTNFTHIDHALSHGIDGKKGIRNSQVIVNLAWANHFMWDGGVNHIEVQGLAPISNPVEMNSKLADVVKKLEQSPYYVQKFKEAYGKKTDITGQNILKSLGQFMVMIQSYNSKYDKVMRNEAGFKFTESEQKGYDIFKANCSSCHTEPLFTNGGFANNGLEVDDFLNDGGRIRITGNPEDSLKFKIPTLRNVEISYPYMHDGRYKNLQMVLFHYSSNIKQTPNLAPELKNGIGIGEQDKNHLISFLKTLTDTSFVKNKMYSYHPRN